MPQRTSGPVQWQHQHQSASLSTDSVFSLICTLRFPADLKANKRRVKLSSFFFFLFFYLTNKLICTFIGPTCSVACMAAASCKDKRSNVETTSGTLEINCVFSHLDFCKRDTVFSALDFFFPFYLQSERTVNHYGHGVDHNCKSVIPSVFKVDTEKPFYFSISHNFSRPSALCTFFSTDIPTFL